MAKPNRMQDKLPADFDADWYAATYPDVALSGMSPREHYRRFARILGRKPKGSARLRPAEPETAESDTNRMDTASIAPEVPPVPTQQPLERRPAKSPPIIDRPKDFDAAATIAQPAPTKVGGAPGALLSLDTMVPALQAYAKLLNVHTSTDPRHPAASVSCGAKPFQAGRARIENASFVDVCRMRLVLAGGNEQTVESTACDLRAYQAHPANPAELRLLEPGIRLPPMGPVFHDVELLHPLMPLLLERSDGDGAVRELAMLPFPSLLPGGIHGAELKALQIEPNPMDDFWALSEMLLQEAVGGDNSPGRSVAGISVAADRTGGDELLLTPFVQEWLAAVFGLSLDAANATGESAVAGVLRVAAESRTPNEDLQLALPPNFVPTISALVSRRLHKSGSAAMIGPYLVAEADTYRPRWSIALPADQDLDSAIPLLRRSPLGLDTTSPPSAEVASIPLGIAVRSCSTLPVDGSAVALTDADPPSRSAGALSVLVHASDEARVSRIIQSVRAAAGGELEFLVSIAHPSSEMRAALDRSCEGLGWTQVSDCIGLREIAREANGETLLTLNDRIEPGDGCALPALLDLLQRRETAGSVGCALLAETVIKKETVLQPASGGFFPTGVSFVSGPHLSFGEPDALQALPDLTYAVAANTRHLTVWRRRALAELPAVPGSASAALDDIRTGLDLMRAGYRNWCTTQVTARLSGSYAARDMIDPVGPGYLSADRWQDILSRVTVIRELF